MGPVVLMFLVACGEQIAHCCGAQMLGTLWLQTGLITSDICAESPGACDEMWASIQAEIDACLSCPGVPWME